MMTPDEIQVQMIRDYLATYVPEEKVPREVLSMNDYRPSPKRGGWSENKQEHHALRQVLMIA